MSVTIHAQFAVPRSASKAERARRMEIGWHTQKPDADNVIKTVLDGLNGVAWVDDDAQVALVSCRKTWHTADQTTVTVAEADDVAG